MYQSAGRSLAIGALGIFLILGAMHSSSLAEEKRQAQSTTTVCNEDTESCEVLICSNENPCETSNTRSPSKTESSIEDNEKSLPPQEPNQEKQQLEKYPPNTERESNFQSEENKHLIERLLRLS
jgi:hypothetical protein